MATASAPPSLIYGAFSFARFEGAESLSYSNDEIRKVFDILVENDIPVDTARAYADVRSGILFRLYVTRGSVC